MYKVTLDADGRLTLPPDLRRRVLQAGGELLLRQVDGKLILHLPHVDVRKVYLELTTRCNLACRTCVRNAWEDPLGTMSDATFERVLAGLRELPELREVVLGGYGEPLSHPHVLDYLAALKGLAPDCKVTISTNGTLLDRERIEALMRLGVDGVTVSLDGASPDTYADVRRGGDLRAVLDNLEALSRRKVEYGTPLPRLAIEFVVLKRNVAELPAVVERARQLGANRVIVTHVLPHTPEMAAEALYRRDETPALPISTGWAVESSGWVLWGILELPRMNWGAERRCRFVADKALVIGWDGGVSPCYALLHSYPYYIFGRRKQVTRYTLGNVNQSTLAEIWRSEDYVRFRDHVSHFDFPSCVDCDLRDSCDLAEVNEGCWGWCPSCADCLWAQDIVRCP